MRRRVDSRRGDSRRGESKRGGSRRGDSGRGECRRGESRRGETRRGECRIKECGNGEHRKVRVGGKSAGENNEAEFVSSINLLLQVSCMYVHLSALIIM